MTSTFVLFTWLEYNQKSSVRKTQKLEKPKRTEIRTELQTQSISTFSPRKSGIEYNTTSLQQFQVWFRQTIALPDIKRKNTNTKYLNRTLYLQDNGGSESRRRSSRSLRDVHQFDRHAAASWNQPSHSQYMERSSAALFLGSTAAKKFLEKRTRLESARS